MAYVPADYQHPLDRKSLMNLRAVKWIESLSKYLVAEDLEQDFLLHNLVDNTALSERDFPGVHRELRRICEVLGLESVPTVFLDTNPAPHSLSVAGDRGVVVLTSGMLDLLEPEELAAVLAHEVGHLVSGHAYYNLLAENFSGLSQLAGVIPGLVAATFAVKLPLYDWYRKADLTADRAAMLAMGSAEPVVSMISKLAGGTAQMAGKISAESLRAQAQDMRATTESLKKGGFRKRTSYYFSSVIMGSMFRTQPWPAIRLLEVEAWASSDRAAAILAGEPLPPEGKDEIVGEDDAEVEVPDPEETAGLLRRWTHSVAHSVSGSVATVGSASRSLFRRSGPKPEEAGTEPVEPDPVGSDPVEQTGEDVGPAEAAEPRPGAAVQADEQTQPDSE